MGIVTKKDLIKGLSRVQAYDKGYRKGYKTGKLYNYNKIDIFMENQGKILYQQEIEFKSSLNKKIYLLKQAHIKDRKQLAHTALSDIISSLSIEVSQVSTELLNMRLDYWYKIIEGK